MRADSPPFFNFSRRLAVVPNCSHDERRGTTDVSFNTTARHANWPVIVLTGILTLAGCNPTAGPQDSATHGPTMDSADAVSLSPTSDASGETDNDTVMSEPIDDSSDGVPAANPPVESRVNRLAHETSPYLLQHARNPVDWHPWGEEALAKAKQENKLIFLSIGYSSCHWCHVMERESFMDSEIARYLNEHFICIKVDREERPDVDNIYMLAVQLITRRGGWPLSVFLTPDAQPFFGGTYFPARDNDRPGATGFLTVIQRVAEVWRDNPAEVRRSGQQLAAAIRESMAGESATSAPALTRTAIDGALHDLAEDFDPRYGGFGYNEVAPDTPKFPQAANLFLLAHVARNESPSSDNEQPPAEEPASPPSAASPASTRPQPQAREMLLKTLDQIAMGGIRDHLGGGFHRYAVDRYWHIPHFEKMLYDNGQLASVYAEAYALTGNPAYARVLDEMFVFLNREMSSPEGGFYAAIDADSEHEEGKFYRWQRSQWDTILGADAAATFAQVYAADGQPNFEQQYYVPLLTTPFAELATARQLSAEQLDDLLAPLRQQLFDVRAQRVRPATDTKILTSWNGMMIRGLADAGRLLERPDYVQRAARAAQFVLKNLQDEQGRLRRTFSAGEARLNAYVDDYACFIDGLLALHRATGETHWLEAAEALTEKQIELFWDTEHGGFFFTSGDHEALIVRGKQLIDNAVPAGNSVAAENLVYLGDVLDRTDYLDYAERTIQVAGSLLVRAPAAAPRLLVAFDQLLQLPPREPK